MPQPARPISLPLMVPGWLPARGGDNTPLFFFTTRTQNATIREEAAARSLATLLNFDKHRLLMCGANRGKKKSTGIVDGCPFTCLNSEYIFSYGVDGSMKVVTRDGRFLFAQTIASSVQKRGHRRHGDNKSPSLSHTVCGNTQKHNNGGRARSTHPAESSGTFNPRVTQSHLRVPQMKL